MTADTSFPKPKPFRPKSPRRKCGSWSLTLGQGQKMLHWASSSVWLEEQSLIGSRNQTHIQGATGLLPSQLTCSLLEELAMLGGHPSVEGEG
jgi:hypothetical protein